MMSEQGLAPHESIELHEILTFKNLCLTKSISMSPLVSDAELKSILREDVAATKIQIEELKELMEKGNMNNTNTEEIIRV
jgi:similar to spore coat protein